VTYNVEGSESRDPCICPIGFAQTGCAGAVTNCPGGRYCANGGTCGDIMCDCPTGWSGGRCDLRMEMDTCADGHVCLNGASCDVKNIVSDSACICASGFGGIYCGEVVVACGGGLECHNGGKCNAGKNGCVCPTGYTGGRCEASDSSTTVPALIPATSNDKGKDERLAVSIAVPLVFVVVGLAAFTCYMVRRERRGDPLFTKLTDEVDHRTIAVEGGEGGGEFGKPAGIEIAPIVRN